jgi:TRAP-type uncharacterized transport system substrate-binding protein
MPTASGLKAFKLVRFTWLTQLFRGRRSKPVQEQTPSSISARKAALISARGIDLDSIEDMMNRRLRLIWVRHTWLVVAFCFLAFCGLAALTVFYTTKPTVLKIAVGPTGSDDVRFVDKLGERMKNEHASMRLQPVVMSGPVSLSDIHGKPTFDLAVVRGNMALSTDWPVVAILRQNVVALIVPPESARAPLPAPPKPPEAKPAKGKKGKAVAAKPKPATKAKKGDDDSDDDATPKKNTPKIADLAGKTVGIVTSTDGGPELLDVILKHYGVPKDKVKTAQLAQAELKSAIYDRKVDVVLVAGPQTGKTIEEAVGAASSATEGPSFIEIDQAEGIGKRTPPYDSIEIPAGAFGGVPPQPDDKLTTLDYPLYLVARKNFNEEKIATFSKFLYTSRQALAYELPGVIAIESPSTDKDAAVLVHNGTTEYLGDNQKSFFDKYGDWIFYGLLVGPILGSGALGALGIFRADNNTQRIRQLLRLLQLVKRARAVTSIEELEALQDEADSILGETIQQTERGSLDEMGLATFSLAIEQARAALSEQRSLLVLRPENVQAHRSMPKGSPVVAAE